MAGTDNIFLQVSSKGDRIRVFRDNQALTAEDIQIAMSTLSDSDQGRDERNKYQQLLDALQVSNRDEAVVFLQQYASQYPSLTNSVNYELDDSKEARALLSTLPIADKVNKSSDARQNIQRQGAANIALLLRAIRAKELDARAWSIRYHVTPWYNRSFSDYRLAIGVWLGNIQRRLARWFGRPIQRSILSDIFDEYTHQYKSLSQDKKDWLLKQTDLWNMPTTEIATPLDDGQIAEALLKQIKMKLLSECELKRAEGMMTSLTILTQLPHIETVHLRAVAAGISGPALAEALAEFCTRFLDGRNVTVELGDLRNAIINSSDLADAVAIWHKYKEQIKTTIQVIPETYHRQIMTVSVVRTILCGGKDAERNWLAIANALNMKTEEPQEKFALPMTLAAAYEKGLFAMPEGAVYHQKMLENPEHAPKLLEGLERAKSLGILTGDVAHSSRALLLSHPEHCYRMAGAIAALCHTPLWHSDVIAETHRILDMHVSHWSYTDDVLSVVARAGLFAAADSQDTFSCIMNEIETMSYAKARLIETAFTVGLLTGQHAKQHLDVLVQLSLPENDYLWIDCMMKAADTGKLLVGDQAHANFEKMIAVSPQSMGLRKLMELAVQIKLLPGHSEAAGQALFDQIIDLAKSDRCQAIVDLAVSLEYSAFSEDLFSSSSTQAQESVLQQQQALFLLLLSSGGSAAEELNRKINNPIDRDESLVFSSLYSSYRSNLITLLRSGINVKYALKGLVNLGAYYWDHPDLLAACHEAIVKAGPNAPFVALALKALSSYTFFSYRFSTYKLTKLIDYQAGSNNKLSEAARKNIDTIIAAGEHAQHVTKILVWADVIGLLDNTGDDIRQTILQRANKSEAIAESLDSLHIFHDKDLLALSFKALLVVEQPEALANGLDALVNEFNEGVNPDDLRTILATGSNAASCCYALAVAHHIYNPVAENVSQEQHSVVWERVRQEIMQRFHSKDNVDALGELLQVLRRYPRVLDQALLTETLTLAEERCQQVAEAFALLEGVSPRFITSENYRSLLNEKKNPKLLARIISGRADIKDLLHLTELSAFSGLVKPERVTTETFFPLYEELVQIPALFSLSMVRGLLQLSSVDQCWLLNFIKARHSNEELTQLLFNEAHGVVAHIMAQTYQLYRSYEVVGVNHFDLPEPNDWESSMRDDYVKLAKERLNALPESMYVSAEQLLDVEIKIREMLLQAIIDEAPLMTNHAEQDRLAKEHHEQRVRFIMDNKSTLARRSNEALNQQAVGLFTELDSTAQTAWRAYEPLAPTVEWPNLLTQSEDVSTIFSTAASVVGMAREAITVFSASTAIRSAAATFFNAVTDPQLPAENRQALQCRFVHQIAEIRRAHNVSAVSGRDSPSCFPGCWSRLGLILDEHPDFVREKCSAKEIIAIVEAQLHLLAQETVNSCVLQAMTDAERRLLLSAIRLYSQPFVAHALSDLSALENNLSVTNDDLERYASSGADTAADITDNQIQKYVDRAHQCHVGLMRQLWQRIQRSLNTSIATACAEAGLPEIDENTLDYLVLKYLSDFVTLVSIPGSLILAARDQNAVAMEASEGQRAEVETSTQRFLATLRHLVEANGGKLHDELLTEVGDRLQVLTRQLADNTPCSYDAVVAKVDEKLADLSRCWMEQTQQQFPPLLTMQSVVDALVSSFPNQIMPPAAEVSATMSRQDSRLGPVSSSAFGLFQGQQQSVADDTRSDLGPGR